MLPEFEDRPGKTDDIAYLLFVGVSLLVSLFASFGSVAVGLYLLSSLPDPDIPSPRYDRILESRLQMGETLVIAGAGGGLASATPLAIGGGFLRSRRRQGSDNDTINIEQSGETTIVSPDLDIHSSNFRNPSSLKEEHPDYEGEY